MSFFFVPAVEHILTSSAPAQSCPRCVATWEEAVSVKELFQTPAGCFSAPSPPPGLCPQARMDFASGFKWKLPPSVSGSLQVCSEVPPVLRAVAPKTH